MKKTVDVNINVEVEVDKSKFTKEFMDEFNENFFELQSVDDHIQYIAELAATGTIGVFTDFIEGYGNPLDFGIKFTVSDPDSSMWQS